LPIRLAPARLGADGTELDNDLQLTLDCQVLLDALVTGRLDWIDALVIGRDSESHTKLVYVLRELLHIGEVPPVTVWFYDQVRLPSAACARYNRIRARQFADTLAAWSGEPLSSEAIAESIDAANLTAGLLAQVADRRRADPAQTGGTDALTLYGAALTLPPAECQELLAAALASPPDRRGGRRVFVSGSPEDDLAVVLAIEAAGFVVVGEDHDWGDRSFAAIERTPDPLDGLVDRYHLGPPGAARAGLDERSRSTARQALERGADVVVQLVFEHDEAPEWELPGTRELLAEHGIPVVAARLEWPGSDAVAIAAVLAGLAGALGGVRG
jgi:benzoyl-CoA reductase/2-hydroxyglutaryl-CoA dehydratase subunit BcrC/BadD/HgdB